MAAWSYSSLLLQLLLLSMVAVKKKTKTTGEEGGGLPLPGVPGQPELRRHAQHDQGAPAARRVQGQDAAVQQVPP